MAAPSALREAMFSISLHVLQENSMLRRQHAEAEQRSSAAELRQRCEAHKQARACIWFSLPCPPLSRLTHAVSAFTM